MTLTKTSKILLQYLIVNSGHHVTMDDLNKMDYLDCVIKESLRMFPPVPFIGRTITQDVTLGIFMKLIFIAFIQLHDKKHFWIFYFYNKT